MAKVKVLVSCAGEFSVSKGKVYEVTQHNANFFDDIVRGGLAEYVKDTRILHDKPIVSLGPGGPSPADGSGLRSDDKPRQPVRRPGKRAVQKHDAELAEDGEAGS